MRRPPVEGTGPCSGMCPLATSTADGLTIWPIALDDAVLLFAHLGHGQFKERRRRRQALAPKKHSHRHHICGLRSRRRSGLAADRRAPRSRRSHPTSVAQQRKWNFTDVTGGDRLGGSGKTASAMLTDLSTHDRAVDLAVTGDGPAPLLLHKSARRKNIPRSLSTPAQPARHSRYRSVRLRQGRLDGYRGDSCGGSGHHALAQR